MKLKTILVPAVLLVGGVALAMLQAPDQTYAASKDAVCQGIGAVSGTNGCAATPGEPTVDKLINTIINILSVLVGVIAVIMIIWGGFRYVTSGGDSSKTGTAKNTIVYALIGLVIVAFAQTLVKFVLQKL